MPALTEDWLQDMYWLVLMESEHERLRKLNEKKALRRNVRRGQAFAFDEDDFDG